MSDKVNATPTSMSGQVSDTPRVTPLTSQPKAIDTMAGSTPRSTTRSHHAHA